MKSLTPLAVFTYNRPQHTLQLLNSLANCSRLDECHIIIFSDAPRIPEHVDGVQETRRLVHEWAKQNQAQVVERSENFGLAHSIVDGVTTLCDEFGRVIVVEDDLILHPAFIHFMLSALNRYSDDERVAQISGYMFPLRLSMKADALFLPNSTSWGWATWTRAWKLFDPKPEGVQDILGNDSVRKRFNLGGASGHSKILQDRLSDKNQSWAILFYLAVFRHQKVVLYPRQSLVYNTGFSGGTHYDGRGQGRPQLMLDSKAWTQIYEFTWPKDAVIDYHGFRKISSFFKDYHGSSRFTLREIGISLKGFPRIKSFISKLIMFVNKKYLIIKKRYYKE